MTKIQQLKNITDEELVEICDTFCSAQEYLRYIGVSGKGQYGALLNKRRKELGMEWKDMPNKVHNKTCPVCDKSFKPGYKNQITCSYSCSNTHFRSGKDNPNYKHGGSLTGDSIEYRRICFTHHPKECIICGEDKIVAVHHYDENHNNNEISNLIPLCPTHHSYMHSKYKPLISDIVDKWRTNRLGDY